MEVTMKQAKDSTVKQRIQDIQMTVSWREIAHTYFGKSASWLYHKLDGIDGNGGVGGFTLWRISPGAAAHRGFLMWKAHGKYAENHNSLQDKQERLH